MATLRRIAAFDVDGTLTRRDCVVPFLGRLAGIRTVGRSLIASPNLAAAAARRDRDRVKAIATDAVFRGLDADAVAVEGADFASIVARERLRDDTLAHLRTHLDDGDLVVLASASYEVYLRPLAATLGVHDVLATRLAVRDGVCTGMLDGANCRGPEKTRRLAEWLADRGSSRDHVHITAYGDSPGDRELLAEADVAVWMTDDGSPP